MAKLQNKIKKQNAQQEYNLGFRGIKILLHVRSVVYEEDLYVNCMLISKKTT